MRFERMSSPRKGGETRYNLPDGGDISAFDDEGLRALGILQASGLSRSEAIRRVP